MRNTKSINAVIEKVVAFRNERDWEQFHNGKDLAICLNCESSELLELFLWKGADQVNKDKVKEELAQVQTESTTAQEKLAALPQKLDFLERELEKFSKQHEINRYLIPASLILALITGGMIALQIKALSELPVLRWIALVLLIAYLTYYAWVYYLTKR